MPHPVYWYNESLNIFLTPLRQKLLYNPVTVFFKRRAWNQKLVLAVLWAAEALAVIGRQKDPAKCKVRRAQVLWEEAGKRGIEMSELLIFGRPFDTYIAEKTNPSSLIFNPSESKIKDKRLRMVFSGLPRPSNHSNPWLDLMDDKWLLKQLLQSHGLPAPAGQAVTNFKQAQAVFRRITKPVIVKPRAGSRGRHSTTFVNDEHDLKKALNIAKQLCHWAMVEEHLKGPVFRATLVNFKLCGVLRGDPPKVVGDGINSISQLISIKNALPHPGVKDVIINDQMKRFLVRALANKVQNSNDKFQTKSKDSMTNSKVGQGSVLDYVPEAGEAVVLSEKIGVNYGGSSCEDFEICHPDNKELFTAAAKVLGDPIVGFDFIIPDIAKSYKQQRCGFIEVNSLPFINLHHDPLLGKPRNVAAKVWDMIGW